MVFVWCCPVCSLYSPTDCLPALAHPLDSKFSYPWDWVQHAARNVQGAGCRVQGGLGNLRDLG